MSEKVSFHITDEQAKKVKEAKDLAAQFGDKTSEILMQGVIPYIEARKTDKVQLFVGNRFNPDLAPDGKYIAFQGKCIAAGSRVIVDKDGRTQQYQVLYKTLKGQYLLYKDNEGLELWHDVYPTVAKLMENEDLAIEIMKALEKDGSGVEWLDI